jgi:hypothetical protein
MAIRLCERDGSRKLTREIAEEALDRIGRAINVA